MSSYTYSLSGLGTQYKVECERHDCPVQPIVDWHYWTAEEAAEAWNTRAERTCHNVWDVELTGRLRFKCSDCGAVSLEITPVYCPACGAKVVEE